ncbi:hypothetical protein Epro_0288 [Endomicrobium proavitum]|uniref:Uncharacterized protein n=1 Tax=Endomicrobium proavitum TaxID=1408281 RepID=A0A0G3WIG4_9BACT|nr:hypothetical protein Epro_0288 [Endomicrobium proavitum]
MEDKKVSKAVAIDFGFHCNGKTGIQIFNKMLYNTNQQYEL